MNNITETQNIESLPVIFWKDQPVITTQLLADVYETDVKNIQMNFKNNADRFIDGKHCFKLQGNDLKEFKNRPKNIGSVKKNARELMLWTERGTVRHAKMLGTDKAWDVQDQLEEFYFSQKEVAQQPEPPKLTYATKEQRAPLVKAVRKLTKISKVLLFALRLQHLSKADTAPDRPAVFLRLTILNYAAMNYPMSYNTELS